MYLIILLDDHDRLLGIIPTDDQVEFSLGELYTYNNQDYTIISIESEEFIDYEIIVNKIRLVETEKTNNGMY